MTVRAAFAMGDSMAKRIVFQIGDLELLMMSKKIDRSKLYGYKEVEVLDDQGRLYKLATLADDGRTDLPLPLRTQGYAGLMKWHFLWGLLCKCLGGIAILLVRGLAF